MKYLLAAILSGSVLLCSNSSAFAQHGGHGGGYHCGGGYHGGGHYYGGYHGGGHYYGGYGYPAFGFGLSIGVGSGIGGSYPGSYGGGYNAPVYNEVPSVTAGEPSPVVPVPPVAQVPAPNSTTAVPALTPEQDASPVMYPGYNLFYSKGRYFHMRQ